MSVNFQSLAQECCCTCPKGCEIPYTTLLLSWTNYDPTVHGPDPDVAILYKLDWHHLIADFRDPTECVWADDLDLASATYILEQPGFAILTDLITLEEWYDDDPNDPNPDPHEMLGNFYHYADFTGETDITITDIS